MSARKPVLIIVGPTASGKSACAIEVASEFNGVVINADSMQVYRDLSVITARPSDRDIAAVPHRLFGVLDAATPCSAAMWRDMALAEIHAAHAKGMLPILCGGTGLYLKALTEGLAPVPDIPDDVRDEVRRLSDEIGPVALHGLLRDVDPETAAKLNPTDPQRVARALEVFRATGKSLAAWQKNEDEQVPPEGLDFRTIAILPPRDILYQRIDRRFQEMINQGAVEEIKALQSRQLSAKLPALKALGVPEIAAYLEGTMSLDTALERGATKSRRYAKRQMTWLRRQIIIDLEVNEQFSERLRAIIFSFIREKLLTAQ